jgi:hypothetical protein
MLATRESTYSLPHPLYAPRQHEYSPNPEINETILWLMEEGLPALPVAPYQPASRYPRTFYPRGDRYPHCPLDKSGNPIPLFCGKNPSYSIFHLSKPQLLDNLGED